MSFCLPADAALVGRSTPVEDFNLYRVRRGSGLFVIYEGNQPQRRDSAHGVKVPLDPSASLTIDGGRGSVLLRTGRRNWPIYLEISGPCGEPGRCAALDLARAVTAP